DKMKLTNSFGILSMIFVTAGAVTVACGPDTGDGEGTGGSGETGGSTNAGGTTGSGGADATGGVSATGGDGFGGMAGYTINTDCDPIPGNLLLTDYSEYTLGAQWTAGGVEEWGGSDTLTGGDF